MFLVVVAVGAGITGITLVVPLFWARTGWHNPDDRGWTSSFLSNLIHNCFVIRKSRPDIFSVQKIMSFKISTQTNK